MRLALLIALLALSPSLAFAQDEVKAPRKEKPAAVQEKTVEKKADAPKVEEAAENEHQPEAEKPKVNWVEVESTGTLSGGKSGALEKTLWQGQKRSEIEKLISSLPAQPHLRSILNLQRRILLTRADTSLMEDDIGPLRGNDLLIQRINKLMDMGLYDDAWELYTKKADDPYDVSIAQMGILLLLMKNDLATACLEEKVASLRYPKDKFFETLDKACSQTLGAEKAPKFPYDATLNAIYNDATYSVSASTPQALSRLNNVQRALLLANGKIRYDGLSAATAAKTPSMLLTYYLMDKALPEAAKAMITAELKKRGLQYYVAAIARDENWAKAKAIHAAEPQWPYLESALNSGDNPADLALYYGNMLDEAKPAKLSPETLEKALAVFLAGGHSLPTYWLDAAQKAATEKPLIYIYLQAFKSLTPTPNAAVKPEDFKKAIESLKPDDSKQILAILESLDKETEGLDSLSSVYDKHSGLTLENNYVMPSDSLNVLMETAPEKKQIGITVLAVLNSLAADPDLMYSGTVRKALYSMLNVGLIEDAKLVGAETVASVLNKY